MNQQIKKWFILPGDYASPACNKNKAICVSIQKHNTLIINKYRMYTFVIQECTLIYSNECTFLYDKSVHSYYSSQIELISATSHCCCHVAYYPSLLPPVVPVFVLGVFSILSEIYVHSLSLIDKSSLSV